MTALAALASMPARINAYSDEGAGRKAELHRTGQQWLRLLAADLGLEKGTFDIRSNKGGIAVSGEVTLHADRLYVQLSEHSFSARAGVSVLYRNCSGRKDYTGGRNHTMSMAHIAATYANFLADCRQLMGMVQA